MVARCFPVCGSWQRLWVRVPLRPSGSFLPLNFLGPSLSFFLYLVVRIIVSLGAGPATVCIVVAPGGGTVLLNAYSTSYSCSWWQNVCLMPEVHETGLIRTTSYITGLEGGDAVSQGIFYFRLDGEDWKPSGSAS